MTARFATRSRFTPLVMVAIFFFGMSISAWGSITPDSPQPGTVLVRSSAESVSIQEIDRPFRSVNDVMRGLNSLTRQFHAIGDRRGLFSGIYAMAFYAGVQDIQSNSGEYHDPKWVRSIMINHANVYRRTILHELRSEREKIPQAWQYAFVFVLAGKWSADLDLIYTNHAHIMGDLVLALLQTPTNYQSPRLKEDYDRITTSLQSAMPGIWSYYKSFPGSTNLGRRMSQKIVGGWIANLRTQAWETAAVYSRLSEKERMNALHKLDSTVARRSATKGILLPLLNHRR